MTLKSCIEKSLSRSISKDVTPKTGILCTLHEVSSVPELSYLSSFCLDRALNMELGITLQDAPVSTFSFRGFLSHTTVMIHSDADQTGYTAYAISSETEFSSTAAETGLVLPLDVALHTLEKWFSFSHLLQALPHAGYFLRG